MNKKFKIILIVILILVVIICGVLIYKLVNKNNIENNIENNTENNDKVNIYKSDILDEKEDGTMFNISDKIREEKNIKKLSGVKVNDISIKFLRTTTLVVGILKNTTDKDIDIGDVTIQIINKDGSVLSEFIYNMGIIKANTEEKLSIPTADDISNINDIAFIK